MYNTYSNGVKLYPIAMYEARLDLPQRLSAYSVRFEAPWPSRAVPQKRTCTSVSTGTIQTSQPPQHNTTAQLHTPMSYNGIGLPSAKGSATSGHVQRSLVRPHSGKPRGKVAKTKKAPQAKNETTATATATAPLLTAHMSKREIELRVAELRDRLEEQQDKGDSITDTEVEDKCRALRKKLREQHLRDSRVTQYKKRGDRTTPLEKSE